jgi:protein SCO1/2
VTRIFAVALALTVVLVAAGRGAMAYSPANLAAFAFQPHPGAELPLGAPLVDENGRTAPLAHFFTGKPVVLVLEYLRCKSLCGVTLENVVAALDGLPLEAGRDFQMLAISIDPRDTPVQVAQAKAKYLSEYHHQGGAGGIHFLTGSAQSVRQIADAIGFPYRYDAAIDQYVHPAGFILASPDGRISRYIFGVAATAPELRAGLLGARQGEALSPLTRLFLLCHVEGAPLGRYTVPVLAAFTLADMAAGFAALVVVLAAVRRRRHG